MSQPYVPKIDPVRAEDIQFAWLENVRGILLRDGQAIRAGNYTSRPPAGELVGGQPIYVIEVQAINTGTWHPLNLPANTMLFASKADRDLVLAKLTGETPIA